MKKGAASFYIVAFSTLILTVIATSFAMVIISEISRSANDDLSQSAYDSALAGVEDAKVAYANYKRCKEAGFEAPSSFTNAGNTCQKIIWWVEKEPNCDMVANILDRSQGPNKEVELGGVAIGGGGGVTTTNQAYTCVMINTKLSDYRATLGSNNKVQTMRASIGNGPTNNVSKIKIGWYTRRHDLNDGILTYSNFNSKVTFGKIGASSTLKSAIPPTLEVQILQTGTSFNLSDFDNVNGNQTNRATVYLVPTNNVNKARENNSSNNYVGVYTGTNPTNGVNRVSAAQVARTNSHTVSNKAHAVYCNPNGSDEFFCTTEIEMPAPIGGGARSNETFMISVALPYQQPDTDFSIEFYCNGDTTCGTVEGGMGGSGSPAMLRNTQISIDSTGRANDLYRRVETRLETSDTTYATSYPYYALQILGSGAVTKNMTVTKEWNFYF